MAQSKHIHDIIARLKGFKKAQKGVKSLSSSMKKFAVGLVSAAAAYKTFAVGLESIKLAGKLEGVENAFNSMRKEAGFSINTFSKLDKALNGTADRMTIMTQANNAMLLGIADSEEQMAEMFDIAQRLAEAVGQDATFGIESLVTGLGRQSKLMLDNLGIMVDTNASYEKYAKELGKTVEQLTDAEKKQGFVNEAMRQGKELVDGLGEETDTTARQLDRFTTSITDFKVAIGQALIDSGVLGQLTSFTDVLVKMAKAYSDNQKSEAELMGITEDLHIPYNLLSEDIEKSENRIAAWGAGINQIKTIVKSGRTDIFDMTKVMMGFSDELKDEFNLIVGSKGLVEAHKILHGSRENEKVHLQSLKESMEELLGLNSDELTQEEKKQAQIVQNIINAQKELEIIEAIQQSKGIFEDFELPFSMILSGEEAAVISLQDRIRELLGLLGDFEEAEMTQVEYQEAVKDSVVIAAKAMKDTGAAFGMNAKVMETLTIAHAIADTYAGANKALAAGIPPFNYIAAAGVVAAGLANVRAINQSYKKAQGQTGFEGVVDEPTQFTVGEGGAAEYVSVTPMEGVNNAGGGGQGITVNISGNVMSDTFVEEELAEKIQEAVRKGISFGIS